MRKNKPSLLSHERELLAKGELRDVTHTGASAVWLEANSTIPQAGQIAVYRPVGDVELQYLLQNRQLPNTQPYQAIMPGLEGRTYAEKYLQGTKSVDTNPTTCVEFLMPQVIWDLLFARQHKAEDGVLSVGLGHKAGAGLEIFNEALRAGTITFRIVKVKRK